MRISVHQLEGSGAAAQPAPFPTFDQTRLALQTLDYKARGLKIGTAAQVAAAADVVRRAIADPANAANVSKWRAALTKAGQALDAQAQPVGVATDNFAIAARIAAAAPLEAVDAFLRVFGPRPDLGEQTRREIFGSLLLELANQQNASLFEIARKFGLPASITGSAGIFDKFAKKASSAFSQEGIGTIFREQVQNKIGQFIAGLGQSVLNISNDLPLFGKFFLKPLGFTTQAQILKQLGNVIKGGSISDFDEKAVGLEAANTLKEAGQALATAAPFFPAPWNAAAGALAGLSIAAGSMLNGAIRAQEQARLAREAEQAQAEQFKRAQEVIDAAVSYGRASADYAFGGKQEPAEPNLRNAEEMQWFAKAALVAFKARAKEVYGREFR